MGEMGAAQYLKDLAKYIGLLAIRPSKPRYMGVGVPVTVTPALRSIRRPIYRGMYEADEIKAISEIIEPDDVVLEAGAGCGIVTAVIASRLRDSRNMHTYEANPNLIPSIRAVSEANNLKPNIVNAALGHEDGHIEFFVDDSFLGSSAIDRNRSSARPMQVPCFSPQTLIDKVKPTILIFDVEGMETCFENLRLPARVRAISCEVHPHIIGDEKVSKLVANFIGQGYSLIVDRCSSRSLTFQRN